MPGAGIVLSASSTSRCEFLTYLAGSHLPYTGYRSLPLLTLEWVSTSKEVTVLRRRASGPSNSARRSSHRASSLIRWCTARSHSTRWNASWSHTWLAAWWALRLSRHWATGTRLSSWRTIHRSALHGLVRTGTRLGLTYRLSHVANRPIHLRLIRSSSTTLSLSSTKIKIQARSHISVMNTKTYP